MTDEELAGLDSLLAEYAAYEGYGGRPDTMQERLEELEITLTAKVPALVAEVRRLRVVEALLWEKIAGRDVLIRQRDAEIVPLWALATAARALADGREADNDELIGGVTCALAALDRARGAAEDNYIVTGNTLLSSSFGD